MKAPTGKLAFAYRTISELEAERDQLRAALSDPEAVFVNMKRGAIAKPRLRSMVDLYGEVINGDEAQLLEIAKLRAEVEALRKDKARLDAIEQECWDVRFLSSPNGDAGDSSISIEVVGHFMAEPCERVVGENYSENLRAAIDQAMTADAYPPVRPEYEEPEDLDVLFPGGGGNKARRRAEALGIDYDAAMAAKEVNP